jgi:hypothetical protein
MTYAPYAFHSWEFAADNHLLKLQCLQNKVYCTTGYFPRRHQLVICTWLLNFSTYDTVTTLCKHQAEVIHVQNYENANVLNIGQGEP